MTYDLFEEITQFQCISKDERLRHVTMLIREKLPEDNYHILKYIVQFLGKVNRLPFWSLQFYSLSIININAMHS